MTDTWKRIQRKRTKGWRMPPGAIYVGRPTKWGNPFYLRGTTIWFRGVSEEVFWADRPTIKEARRSAAESFRNWIDGRYPGLIVLDAERERIFASIEELAGHDLACWCPLTDAQGNPVPCHADVLLSFAVGGNGS